MKTVRTAAALTLVLALGATATADATVRIGAVRSLDAVEGLLSPPDRIVAFDDEGACQSGAYAITIRWGDGTESAGRVAFSDDIPNTSGQSMRCVYQATGRHVYGAPGTFPLSARVCRDAECVESFAGGVARVSDARIRGEALNLAAVAGSPLSAELGEFNDDNRTSSASGFRTVVDWGDGTTSPGTLRGDGGRFKVSGEHTYATAGAYVLRLTLLENGAPVAVADAGTVTVAAAPAATPAPAVAVPTLQTAASSNGTSFRPTMRMRTRSVRRSALRRGIGVRVSVPSTVRSLRMAVVRVNARPRTIGTVTVPVRGGRSDDGVRQVDLRVRLSRSLRAKLRPGTYAIQFRVGDSGLVSGQFRVRR